MWVNSRKKPVKQYAEDLRILIWSKICLVLNEVKEVPNTLNRLRESEVLSSIFPKYAIVMFVVDLKKKSLHARLQELLKILHDLHYDLQKMPNWSKWWKIVCWKKHFFCFDFLCTKWNLSGCVILKRRNSWRNVLF